MRSRWFSALMGALLGAAAATFLLRADGLHFDPAGLDPVHGNDRPKGADSDRALSVLRAERDRERARSEELENRLNRLEERFGFWLSQEEPDWGERRVGPEDESPSEAEGDSPWFDSESLVGLGIAESEVERIREVWASYTLRKLRIQNQRNRRGKDWTEAHNWIFLTESDARNELGDESYEAMRYAAGERNRVIISELLENSPAVEVGLEPQDEFISYDGQRVFSPSELKQLIAEGTPGSWVEVQVLRQGELHRVFLKREPIGVRLEYSRRPPHRPF